MSLSRRESADPLQEARRYRSASVHFLENAMEFLRASELEKASELMWGSLAQALKAVAALKGIELKSHNHLRDYARQLARELQDERIFETYRQANSLHSNFYEAGLMPEEVLATMEPLRQTLRKLLGLVPEEV